MNREPIFIPFQKDIEGIERPEQFNFPFYYEPHPLASLAAEQLQEHILQMNWQHNFGIKNPESKDSVGKMFGVLVVENQAGQLGFLAAFSGKIDESNHWQDFVPPVFDTLIHDGFYKTGERELNQLTKEIEALEKEPQLLHIQQLIQKKSKTAELELEELRAIKIEAKKQRKEKRTEGKRLLPESEYAILEKKLAKESVDMKYHIKRRNEYWAEEINAWKSKLQVLTNEIDELKKLRKNKSNKLQNQLFESYRFLNILGEKKDLIDIFKDTPKPAGSGECAAPKLLQYAFLHNLKPITMAEFWWGKSPNSSVRYHKHFYPACTGKCKPILVHMLKGMKVDKNPLEENPALGKTLPILFEDEHIIVVNKPAEFLSVPGKTISDSVQLRMQLKYPDATGPMIVHRLDMSTSGILLLAKTKENYKHLQQQFSKRKVKKRYVAKLEGHLSAEKGTIELPLRVDLDNRPNQVICYEYGRYAKTEWELIERDDKYTKVYFYPITGRTHQLRVHAAHPRGLGCPIVGDDLYGTKGQRLHLHAETLEFTHPVTHESMKIQAPVPF